MPSSAIRRHGPLLAVAASLCVATAVVAALSVPRNDGHFIYALDDTYIHMALARNLAWHGVWGIDGRAFTPCSSSPLWTLLLTLTYRVAGVRDLAPFGLALVAALAVIVVSHLALLRSEVKGPRALGALGLLALATPLPTLVFVANEHALHALLTLTFAFLSARALAEDGRAPGRILPLAILGAAAVLTRYESLFLIAVATGLFAARKRWRDALSVAAAAAAAVSAFGVVSVLNGGYFLPNSVLMKAKYPWLGLGEKVLVFLGPSLLSEAFKTPEVAGLVIGALLLLGIRYRRTRRAWDVPALMLILFVGTAILHLDFARSGEFYRYEAYLVALGVLAGAIALAEPDPSRATAPIRPELRWKRVLGLAAVAAVVVPLAWRGIEALRNTPTATGNIYQQQYQMGMFLKEFYPGDAVAANDIGVINYVSSLRCVDLWGLASREVAQARRAGIYGPGVIRAVVEAGGASVAIVFDRWFERFGGLPEEWIRVGQWTIPNNVVCGNPTVTFYAPNGASAERLRGNLRRFSVRLPRAVVVTGAIAEGP